MKQLISMFLYSLLSASVVNAAHYALPSDNQGYWEPGVDVGVIGGIDQYRVGGASQRTNLIDVTQEPYNADNTGATDCKAALVAAIAAASAKDVVYLPAGDYLLESGYIYIAPTKDDITIRGAGVGVTKFICKTIQPIFVFNGDGRGDKDNPQEVLGAKTKGTANLQVNDSSSYSVGNLCQTRTSNEEDDTRIQAGAAPSWSSALWPAVRKAKHRVTAVPDATHVTVSPPLIWDGTPHTVTLSRSSLQYHIERVGFEDFSVSFNPAAHVTHFIITANASNCWMYNVHFENFARRSSNGDCISFFGVRNGEIRKCRFTAVPGSSSDGAVQTGGSSNSLFIDNIIEGSFGTGFYDSGGSVNNAYLYNYGDDKLSLLTIFHNAHPSLNLLEGNYAQGHQSDGYHGSSSHNTLFRNVYTRYIALNRFKRNYGLVANVLGVDGVRNGAVSWGNPNMGNGSAEGFAGPTGLSQAKGEADYIQQGYGVFEYIIKEADIYAGDFWRDWMITGTLTTRTSDTEGIFTMDKGHWFVGSSPTGAGRLYPTVWNATRTKYSGVGKVTNVKGNLVTITWTSGVLPAQGEAGLVFAMGATGWQERDLDVKASSFEVENYYALAAGTGSVAKPTTDIIPDSLAYSAQPSWWTDDGFAGTWPPVDPNSPTFSGSIIPAGARALGIAPPPAGGTAPSAIRSKHTGKQ